MSCLLSRLLTSLSSACTVPSAWDTIPGPVRPVGVISPSLRSSPAKAGLRWRLRLCGLMHLSRAIGAVAGRLPGWVGGTVSLPTSLCQAGAGARAHMGITGQGRKAPGPGVWWPGGSWDEGRKTCGQKFGRTGTSLVVRWVRLSAPNAGVGGTQVRSLVRELDPACCNYKVPCAATKIPRAETKTRCSQNKINK